MNNYLKQQKLMIELEKHFANELTLFSEHVCSELTSLIAFAVIEANMHFGTSKLKCFKQAIEHITQQRDLVSYLSLTEQQQLCVDIFAQQTISQQEHIVYYKKNYLDTLRIYDAPVELYETSDKPLESENSNGFIDGFISLLRKLQSLIPSVVSSKTGDSNEK